MHYNVQRMRIIFVLRLYIYILYYIYSVLVLHHHIHVCVRCSTPMYIQPRHDAFLSYNRMQILCVRPNVYYNILTRVYIIVYCIYCYCRRAFFFGRRRRRHLNIRNDCNLYDNNNVHIVV